MTILVSRGPIAPYDAHAHAPTIQWNAYDPTGRSGDVTAASTTSSVEQR